MSLKLSHPNMRFFPSYLTALKENFAYGSGDPFSVEEIEKIEADPAAHLKELQSFKGGNFTAENGNQYPRVPQEKIWITDGDNFIGAINFRPVLNEMLVDYGGHAGYSITPSARGKEYMTSALKLLLSDNERMTQVDRDYLVVTTDPDNVASQKTALKNGGTLVKECFFEPMKEDIQVYHIPLKR